MAQFDSWQWPLHDERADQADATGAGNGQRVPTQSLIVALQATMENEDGPIRKPIVIPGSGRRRQKSASAQALPRKLVYPRWQLAFLTLAATFFISLSLLSMTPVGHGQGTISPVKLVISLFDSRSANSVAAIEAQKAQEQQQEQQAAQQPIVLSTSQYVQVARDDAVKYGIPPDAYVRQIQVESGFNPYAVSPSGAVGIAQFLPSTAASLGFDPWDPIAALDGGARYMAQLSATYGGNYAKALAAYNAGSGNLNAAVQNCGDAWLSCLPAETQNYVARIMG